MKNNMALNKYFKMCYAPDELYIPTIVLNSVFKRNASVLETSNFKALAPLHYLNYIGHILSYDENDYDTLMTSGKIFVRKMISGKSEKLIEMIDKHNDVKYES